MCVEDISGQVPLWAIQHLLNTLGNMGCVQASLDPSKRTDQSQGPSFLLKQANVVYCIPCKTCSKST